jgi:hypothetical protein
MRRPSHCTRRAKNRLTRQLRVEQLESRDLLTVILDLPSYPVPATEGQPFTFDVSGHVTQSSGTLSYNADQMPAGATLDSSSGVFRWTPPDGPVTETVKLRVRDNDGEVTGSFQIAVANLVPTVGVSGPSDGVRGQPLTFVLTATDPSPVNPTENFVFTVDWGDGLAPQTISGPSETKVEHVFVVAKSYQVSVTAKDNDGGVSIPVSKTVTITATAIQTDPLDTTKSMLVVGGTLGSDKIVLNPSKGIKVLINGKTQGNFAPTSRIVVYGQAGNDDIQVAGAVRFAAWLYGGDGNDRLKGGNAHDLLFGGLGNDNLLGGQGNDLLGGDAGADRLVGEAGDDILIDGSLTLADGDTSLQQIMDEWKKPTTFEDRVSALKTTLVVTHDSNADKLTGSAGLDWFFYDGRDVVTDLDVAKPKKKK